MYDPVRFTFMNHVKGTVHTRDHRDIARPAAFNLATIASIYIIDAHFDVRFSLKIRFRGDFAEISLDTYRRA